MSKRISINDVIGPDGLTDTERYERYAAEQRVRQDGGETATAFAPSKPLTPEQIFAYRQTHEGRNPPSYAGDSAGSSKAWTGEELFAYRQTHDGKNPPGVGGGAR